MTRLRDRALLLGIFLGAACTDAEKLPELRRASGFIGSRRTPGPRRPNDLGGYMIPSVGGYEYGVEIEAAGNDTLLLLSRMTGRDAQGRPGWEVIAAVHRPLVQRGYVLVLGMCRARKETDSRIVAIARSEDTEFLSYIVAAWRVDARTATFAPIPIAGIDCENEGWGA